MIEQQACKVAQPTGSGPRHAVLHGDILVTLREYSTIITSQLVPPLVQNICDTVSNLLIVPEDQASLQGAKFVASEALIPSASAEFSALLYASNRNTGPNGDPRGGVVAVFVLDAVDGKHQIISQFFTGLKQVRGCNSVNRITGS